MAVVVLVLWALTAGVGVFLLRAVSMGEVSAPPAGASAPGVGTSTPPAGVSGAVQQEGHPLLEFTHPALGVIGLGFWFMFVASHYRRFAWIAIGVLAATVTAGSCWLVVNVIAGKRRRRAGGVSVPVPARLIVVHGLAAATTTALAVLTPLIAGHL